MRLPPMPPAWQVLAARTDLRSPDQDRYGSGKPCTDDGPADRDGLLLLIRERGGLTVQCDCGWTRWHREPSMVKTWAGEHSQARKKGDDVTYECPELRRLEKSR